MCMVFHGTFTPKTTITPGGAVIRLLDQYPNIYGDLSANSGLNAITRDPDFGRQFLIDYQDRLLFGTDTSGSGNDERYDFYSDWQLTKENNPWGRSFDIDPLPDLVQDKILRLNARKLLKLN